MECRGLSRLLMVMRGLAGWVCLGMAACVGFGQGMAGMVRMVQVMYGLLRRGAIR